MTGILDEQQVVFEATSRDNSIVVLVGEGGACLGVRLAEAAMRLTDADLANRIMLLSTWGRLRAQLALRDALTARHAEVSGALATAQQVSQFETLIDF